MISRSVYILFDAHHVASYVQPAQIMKSDVSRISHEQQGMKEKIKVL